MFDELRKRKVTAEELTIIMMRQILANQATLLSESGRRYQDANETRDLVKRVDEFIKNKE